MYYYLSFENTPLKLLHFPWKNIFGSNWKPRLAELVFNKITIQNSDSISLLVILSLLFIFIPKGNFFVPGRRLVVA